jgi:hypothetical protein
VFVGGSFVPNGDLSIAMQLPVFSESETSGHDLCSSFSGPGSRRAGSKKPLPGLGMIMLVRAFLGQTFVARKLVCPKHSLGTNRDNHQNCASISPVNRTEVVLRRSRFPSLLRRTVLNLVA